MIKKIEKIFRHFIVYPVLRQMFHNPEINIPIDIKSINKLLILRFDRIGDMIVTTPIFSALKKIKPSLKIGVLASEVNAEIIKFNPNVDKVYILPKKLWKIWTLLKSIREEHYDMVINLVFNRMTSGGIISNLTVPKGIKIGQGADKYRFYFNYLFSIQRDEKQMVEIISSIVQNLFGVNIPTSDNNYELYFDDATKLRVNTFLEKNNLASKNYIMQSKLPYIVFNLSSSDYWTRLSVKQVQEIIIFLKKKGGFHIVIILAPNDKEMLEIAKEAKLEGSCLVFPETGKASLLEIAWLIANSICVISPDTSIIHFASGMKIPVVGIYTSAKEKKEWLPYNVPSKIIMSDEKSPVSQIPSSIIIEKIDEFINGLLLN